MDVKRPEIPLQFSEYAEEEMLARASAFYELTRARRTVRQFSSRAVPREVLALAIRSAGTAPSGANMQPWHFVAISDPALKREIRLAAELEEREFYGGRAPDEWLQALAPLGTDDQKPFLETAPYLIAIFLRKFTLDKEGTRHKHYYTSESVGIATGLLITALHNAGVATLTHTPSPMKFLNRILGRPTDERPFLLLVIGYPEEGATVPDISRYSLEEIATFL
jgi:iodotyrosine deiodinase